MVNTRVTDITTICFIAFDAWYHDLCGHRLSQHDDDD
jgi:hypothetical protein